MTEPISPIGISALRVLEAIMRAREGQGRPSDDTSLDQRVANAEKKAHEGAADEHR